MDFDHEKIWRSPFLIGAIGAVVAFRTNPYETWKARVFNVSSGAFIAGYVSPAACEYLGLVSPSMQSAMAFASGLLGMNLVAMLVGWTKNLQLADILPSVKRKKDAPTDFGPLTKR